MSSDATAQFFANKKKKKTFKFNANLVDASAISQNVVAVMEVSTTSKELEVGSPVQIENEHAGDSARDAPSDGGEIWDDAALAANLNRKGAVSSSSTATSELLDMKSLDPKRNDQDVIAEKLRVEETKAQLAAAREGMEREAAKLREEREKKEVEKKESEKTRFAATAATGNIWVPSRLRTGAAATAPRVRIGGQKLDVEDEELFPDLASAEKILEKKEKDQPAHSKSTKSSTDPGLTESVLPASVNRDLPAGKASENLPNVADQANGQCAGTEKIDSTEPIPGLVSVEESRLEAMHPDVVTPDETPSLGDPISIPSGSDEVATKELPKKKKSKKKDLSTFKPSL